MADEQPETQVDEPAGPPRWVEVTGVVVAVVVLLFIVLHLMITGGGGRGPGRHGLGHLPTSTVAQGALQ